MTATCRPGSRLLLSSLVLGVVAAALFAAAPLAKAQVFGPPSTFYGSVTDAAGPVDAGLTVEAWVGNTLCGSKGKTEFVGEGSARVTVYSVDAVSKEQTPGCGAEGVDVRIKIGDRFAPNTGKWKAGPVQVDVTFGNATPAAIPTFTPTPGRTAAAGSTAQPAAGTPVPGAAGSSGSQGDASGTGSVGTVPAGSPGAGSPVATLGGGLATSSQQQSNAEAKTNAGDDGGGFPIWAGVAIALVVIAAVGGGVGYGMSRSRHNGNGGDAPDRA